MATATRGRSQRPIPDVRWTLDSACKLKPSVYHKLYSGVYKTLTDICVANSLNRRLLVTQVQVRRASKDEYEIKKHCDQIGYLPTKWEDPTLQPSAELCQYEETLNSLDATPKGSGPIRQAEQSSTYGNITKEDQYAYTKTTDGNDCCARARH